MTDLVPYQEPARYTLDLAPDAWQLASKVANTEFVPKALRGKPEAVLACILAGAEAGVSPMQALSKIHVVDGRPAMSAELMRALVLRHGHEIWIEDLTNTACTVAGCRSGSARTSRVTWTMDDARTAGLSGKDNWRKYPRSMLQARATAELCRMIFPDVLAGISHTLEELQDGDGFVEVVAAGDTAPAAPAPARAKAKARKAATAPGAPPPDTAPATSSAPPPPAPALPGEDDIADAELVEPAAPSAAPASAEDDIADAEVVPWPEDPEPPAPEPERRYSAGQIIAMKFGDLGITDRAERLAATSALLGREVTSSADLTPDEVRTVLEALNAGAVPSPAPAPEAAPPPPVVDAEPHGEPEAVAAPPSPPAASGGRRDPDSWSADDWRKFIGERKLKVAVVMREAHRLGAERGVQVGTLEDVAGAGIAVDLVGFIEDQSLGAP